MITAVDTSVLIDIFVDDPLFRSKSVAALREARDSGRLVACDAVWAETSAWFSSTAAADDALTSLDVLFDEVGRAAAAVAGRGWRAYRSKGGPRRRMLPDFLIAAHAQQQTDRLLTRDRGFTRSYFPELQIVDPTL